MSRAGVASEALAGCSPWVRLTRVQEERGLAGEWVDYDHVFTFIQRGRAEFHFDGSRIRAAAGTALIMPPGVRHVVRSPPGMAFIQHIVHFDMAYHPQRAAQRLPGMHRLGARSGYPVELSPFAGRLPCALLPAQAADACRAHFTDLRRLEGVTSAAATCQRQAALLQLVALVLEHEDGSRPVPPSRPSRSWRSLHRAIECILARLDDPDLDLGAIAHAADVVPAYLPQLFRSQLGISVRRYLLQVRIRRAKELLAAGESVTGVAEATGFRGIHAFSRAFRRVVGVPPSAAGAAEHNLHSG